MIKTIATLAIALAAMANVASSNLVPVRRSASASDVVIAMAEPQGQDVAAVFRFVKSIDGNGLELAISASGLEKGGEYPFHIHVNNVPSNGNCTATGGHLDPFGIKAAAGDAYKCSADDISNTCELGDLAGIFGNLVGDDEGKCLKSVNATELTFGGKSTILDHSIVIHNAKGDRVACSNITGFILAGDPISAAGIHDASEMEDMDDMEGMDNMSDTSGGSSRAAMLSGALLSVAAAALF
ncbi:hypothetical protein GGH19_003077 [Coemansia sp. RSA 1807]|nr:hypothetical protein LPJ58_005368 [Coemansia sp. RSA 1591]KAJ1754611.1 hypothetical protein LPJ69_005359 [Coemansia sp. RSA 1752]KAJ1781968.1 hypothetical protein LPJ62_005623 [Coemansia sp. RSA 2167]KAJ2443390.1 hypothetical protein IWW46_002556 [Coemansia sp. RSA 2440]KAJ2533636.1 hypothetical protein IWW43_002667 [Coemansia sp. RSA 1935]KAJ2575326.1 hypothetical protein GGH19_003077 [Coemansia sp. RSA 1807]KAJ2721704.1 hypothetical protein H4S00_002911 [Coemansia sp. D1744]